MTVLQSAAPVQVMPWVPLRPAAVGLPVTGGFGVAPP